MIDAWLCVLKEVRVNEGGKGELKEWNMRKRDLWFNVKEGEGADNLYLHIVLRNCAYYEL